MRPIADAADQAVLDRIDGAMRFHLRAARYGGLEPAVAREASGGGSLIPPTGYGLIAGACLATGYGKSAAA